MLAVRMCGLKKSLILRRQKKHPNSATGDRTENGIGYRIRAKTLFKGARDNKGRCVELHE
ncbi:MAG: hypothetical protein C0413_01035 [Clostridiales bacterium]|nr:hypothetical protein [Clostridiales bacterium]